MAGAPKKTDADRLQDAMLIINNKNDEIAAQRKMIMALQKSDETARTIRENIHQIAGYDPDPPEWLVKSTSGNDRGCPITVWSDWHYGEVVFKSQVGGVNEYNNRIAKERVKRLVTTTIDLAHNHMGNAKVKYPGIVICLGGDMLGGDIHEELMKTNDKTTQQCINDLIDMLAAGIETMATHFGKVFVPCVVGNHGRSTKKMMMKHRVFTSHEWNVYCALARHFKSSKNVQFMIPEEADARFKVYGHRYMLTHGDSLGVKGGDGIIGALGPILRGTLKTHRSESQIKTEFDTLIIGHWHQALWLPGVIVAGTLKGYDEYARLSLRAPFARPSQPLWFTHPKHGITAQWTVYLEEQQRPDAREWVTWEKACA
jgi:hypothetical protein